jgi:hypothetical protein
MKTKARLARLTCNLSGKFIRWRKGRKVKAKRFRGMWILERVPRSRLTILNELAGVPRSSFEFIE